jgi:enterochelin esterase family protein
VQREAAADPSSVEKFWRECAGRCPLVEPTDAPQQFLVTFLWRGDANLARVEARGGPYRNSRVPFERLDDTDVWFRSEVLPADARFVYGLIVTTVVEKRNAEGGVGRELVDTYPLDPLNSNVFNEGPVLELPDAPKDAWHVPGADVPKGQVQACQLESAALNETRGLRLYTPADFDPQRGHALAVFLDGEDCERLMSIPIVLDNLIAAGEIPPTVALMVDSQKTRERDLVFSDAFVRFLADEAVPWAAKQSQLRLSAKTTLIGGVSLGGLTAAYAAQQRPEVFANVLSQSGAFWRPHPEKSTSGEAWFAGEVSRQAPTSVHFYLEVGRFESPSMIDNNRRLRDVLKEKGNHLIYQEYNSGHDHVNWRVSLGSGLRVLLAPSPREASTR